MCFVCNKISRELTCGYFYQCKTPIGSRLLLRWIKQPLVDKLEIEARLDLVGLLMEQVQVRQALQVYIYAHTHTKWPRGCQSLCRRAPLGLPLLGGISPQPGTNRVHSVHRVPGFCLPGFVVPVFVLVACRFFWREKEKTRERKKVR